MSVPGEFTAGDVLAAAEMNALPGGILGYTEVTATQTGITTLADLTGMSATVTVPASRRVRIRVQGHISGSVAGDVSLLRIRESTTTLNAVQYRITSATADVVQADAIVSPSSGSHTYKASLERFTGSGSVDFEASSTRIAFILVEDIGSV